MDPLSITAGILAVIGAGSTVGKGLKKLSASRLPILLQLNNEVTDLQYVVQGVHDILQQLSQINRDDEGSLSTRASLASALGHVKETLLALESVIAYRLTTIDSRDGRTKVDRISWLQVEKKVQSIKDDIRTDRVRLSTALSLLASSSSLQSHEQMRILSSKLDLVHVPILQIANASLGPRNSQTLRLPDPHQTEHLQTLDNGCDSSQALLTDSSIETPISSSETYQAQSAMSNTGITPYEVNFGFAQSLCEQGCDCACHRRGQIRSPSWLNAVLGSLFFGYNINPWMKGKCDSRACRGRSTYIVYTYAFPQWLLNQMVRVKVAYEEARGPEFCLRIVRVRSEGEFIWQVATEVHWDEDKAIDQLKSFLIDGEASVLDVDPHGWSALALAVQWQRYEVAAFLIQAGSDMFHESSQGLCPYTLYWQNTLSRQSTSKVERDHGNLYTPFGEKPCLSQFRFPALTRAYVGSSRKNFSSVLSMTPRSEIDDTDATGSTALSWAARYGDCDSVQKLLLCGSNPSHRDLSGQTPLHIAAETGDIALVNLLLSAKSDVNSVDIYGYTALNVASRKLEGTRLVDSLISHGANVENQNNDGLRPLHASVWFNAPANMHTLLDKGADINAVDNYGTTSLLLGVYYNAHDALRVLLREEALEYDGKDWKGRSVLDYAALNGDTETIRLLQSSPQMKTVDLNGGQALDSAKWRRDNNEAHSLLEFRAPDKDPQLQYSAFKALWNSIVDAQQLDIEEHSDVESNEEEPADDDEEQKDEDDEQTDNDGNENDNADNDDDDDDDANSELWADAPESQHGSTN